MKQLNNLKAIFLLVLVLAVFTAGCDGLVITENTDPSYCEKQTGEDFFGSPLKEVCYERLAKARLDYSLCAGTNPKYKESCIAGVASDNLDLAGCSKLSLAANVKSCQDGIKAQVNPERILVFDDKMDELVKRLKENPDDQDASDRLMKIQAIRESLLATLSPADKAIYVEISEPTNRKIAGEFAKGDIDLATKDSMFLANKVLREKGITLDDKGYEALKNYHAFLNDPDNKIENMDNSAIVKDRFGDKVGNAIDKLKFWETNPTPEEKGYDEQLRFYQRMLEQQQKLFKEQQKLEKALADATGLEPDSADTSNIHKNDNLKLTAEQKVAAYVFGKTAEYPLAATLTALPLSASLSAVKKFAEDAEFRGLVSAYDYGMKEELGKFKGDYDKASVEVVKRLNEDPTYYGSSSKIAQYGNLLANKDCDGTNPHCIKRDVFWAAMKKSYVYQAQKQT
jgi:hypothetical protein